MSSTNYPKSYKSPEDLIALLESRGLNINNKDKANSYLRNIGYFRLSAYFYPFLEIPKEKHIYKNGATFAQVIDIYRFDKKLRLLVFNEIEKIEVAIRSSLTNIACDYYNDIFWITNSNNFYNKTYFKKYINSLKDDILNSSEDFIKHFSKNYNNEFPPSWCISEILSLGSICHIYKNIKDNALKKKIAKNFGLNPIVFESWILTLAGLRNICCHHGRLWNRTLKLKPIIPNKTQYNWLLDSSLIDIQKIYYRLCIIKYFLVIISSNNTLTSKLENLLMQYPRIDINAMGFINNWKNEPLWK